jgi:UDPglucose--hexose-1-phosphate uridylyltransferase
MILMLSLPRESALNRRSQSTYTGTYVFDNDFPALLLPESNDVLTAKQGFLKAEPEAGITRVICFSPRHDLSLPEMSLEEVEAVLRTWSEQTLDLGQRDWIGHVQVFENKGAMMGASNPHPHSQIWATSHIPNEAAVEIQQQARYRQEHDPACCATTWLTNLPAVNGCWLTMRRLRRWCLSGRCGLSR